MDAPRYSSIRDYLHVLRANALVIILITAVCAGAAYYLSDRKATEYTSSAVMAFREDTRDLELLGAPVSNESAADQLPVTRAQAVAGIDVATRVKRALRTSAPPAILASKISAGADAKTGLVTVTARDSTARSAAVLATQFARQYASIANAQARLRFAKAANIVRRRLDATNLKPENQALRASYADQLARLRFLQAASTPARVLSRPAVAGVQVSKNEKRNAALGVALGLTLGILIAFMRDALDRRIRGANEVEARLRLPVIGRVRARGLGLPVAPTDAGNSKVLPEVEAYRILRQNLEFLADVPFRTVAVTSAASEEGKSTVAASLAASTAATGRKTLLIECDLRRPEATERLGLKPGPGLTEYLRGEVEPSEVLQRPQPNPLKRRAKADSRAWPGDLVCLPAGGVTDQPAELLGSERFRQLLRECADTYEMIILDTPPLLPVADTLEVLPLVDVILFCVRSGRTTMSQAEAGKSAINHYPDRPIGVVVTGLSPRDDREYRSYYGAYRQRSTSA